MDIYHWFSCFYNLYIYIYIYSISTLNSGSLKLMDKFTYHCSSVSSTESNINMRLVKAWTSIDKLSIIWKADLSDKIKCNFFQAAAVSILLYGCTTWTLTKRLEKKLNRNYTRMPRAILNKSWKQHPIKQQPYSYLIPISKTIQVRRTRHAALLKKQGRTHKWPSPMGPFIWTSQC